MAKERKPSDVPTESVDDDIPEEGARRAMFSTPAVGPASGVGDTALGKTGEEELGPGERALEHERRTTRARPRP